MGEIWNIIQKYMFWWSTCIPIVKQLFWNLPPDCAQSGWGTQVGFWSADCPRSLCTTSPLSSKGFLLSCHNSRTAVVGNQDLAVKISHQVSVSQTVLTYLPHLLDLIWDGCLKASENSETFVRRVDVIDVDLKFFVWDGLQHLLPGQLLSFLHFLFALFLKVQSEPEKRRETFNFSICQALGTFSQNI